MMTLTVGRLSFTVEEAKVLRTKSNASFFGQTALFKDEGKLYIECQLANPA
jgi:hypothetical protein